MRELRAQLLSEWPAKLWLGALLTLLMLGGYFAAQRFALRAPIVVPATPMDGWIAFDSRWVYGYQSLYLLLPVAWLARSWPDLRRYAIGFLIISIAAIVCFVLVPTTVTRPEVAEPAKMYRLLVTYDRPLNCLPSLHVALAVFSTCFAATVMQSRKLAWALAVWCVLISYSTLAIKQHLFIDVVAGAALGLLGHSLAWKGAA